MPELDGLEGMRDEELRRGSEIPGRKKIGRPRKNETTLGDPQRDEVTAYMDFVDACGGGVGRVLITRVTEAGEHEYLGSVPATGFTLDSIAKTHGAGRYLLKLRNERGAYVVSKTVLLADQRPAAGVDPGGNIAAAAFSRLGAAPAPQLEMYQVMMKFQQELIIALVSKNGAGSGGASVTELVQGLAALHALQPPPADPAPPIETVMEAVKTAMDLGRKANGAPAAGASWVELLKDFLPMITQGMQQPALSAAPAAAVDPAAGAPAPGPPAGGGLSDGIQFLKGKAAAGKDVNLYIDFLLENSSEEQLAELAKICAAPFETLISVDADLGADPFRTWFFALYTGLRSELLNIGDPSGPGGNESNPPSNG